MSNQELTFKMIVASNFARKTINRQKNGPGIHIPTVDVNICRIFANMNQLCIQFTLEIDFQSQLNFKVGIKNSDGTYKVKT